MVDTTTMHPKSIDQILPQELGTWEKSSIMCYNIYVIKGASRNHLRCNIKKGKLYN